MSSNAVTHWTRAHGTLLLAVSLEPTEIGRRIAQARDRKGWTQLAFALEADVSPSTVTRWEAGKLPPIRELMRIAELLGVNPEQLVEPEPKAASQADELRLLRTEIQELREILERVERQLPPGDAPA